MTTGSVRHGAGEVRGPRPGRSRGRLRPSAGRPGQGRGHHVAPAARSAWSWRSAGSTGSPPKRPSPSCVDAARRCASSASTAASAAASIPPARTRCSTSWRSRSPRPIPRRGGDADVLRRRCAAARGRMSGGRARRSRAVLAGECRGRSTSTTRPTRGVDGLPARAPLSGGPGPGVRRDRAMPIRLDSRAADFAARFAPSSLPSVRSRPTSRRRCARSSPTVAAGGDAPWSSSRASSTASTSTQIGLAVTRAEIEIAYAACDRSALDALTLARDRIEAYHRRQLPADDRFTDALGVELGLAGPRSRRSGSTFPAAPPPIPPRC